MLQMQSLPKFQKKSPYQHCRLQSPKVNTKIPSCVQEVPSCETVGWKLGEYVMELLCWLVFFICPLGKNVAGLTMFLIIWHRKRLSDLWAVTPSAEYNHHDSSEPPRQEKGSHLTGREKVSWNQWNQFSISFSSLLYPKTEFHSALSKE